MTQIEKIKAEIERRINYLNKYKDFTETAASARQELIYLQSFIESQEKEQDSRYDRLMAYVKSCYKTLADGKGNTPEGNGYLVGMGDILRFAEKIEELPTDDSPKIKGWLARDKDDTLFLGRRCPERIMKTGTWMGFAQCMKIDKELFPELKWEDEPIEVELTIHRV